MNWKVSRAFTTIGSGTTPKSDDASYYDNGTINWLITGDVNDGEIKNIDRKITAKALSDYSALHIYPVGSIIITMYGAIGKIGMLTESSTVNQACCVLVPGKNVFPKYALHYFLATRHQLIELGVGGVQSNVSQDIIKSLRISLPSVEMQRNIASYLDRKVSIIDKIIAAKNHTHTHLLELRQAIITDAVLGRGSVGVNYRQTNIPWIGKIPAHWQVRRIKDIADISVGWTPDTNNPDYFNGNNTWVTIADMNQKYIVSSKVKISNEAIDSSRIRLVKKGSLLYSFKLSVGKVAFAGKDLYTNEAIAAITPNYNNEVDTSFLYYAISTYLANNANENIYGAKIMNQDTIRNSYIAFPDINEQLKISRTLDKKVRNIDNAVSINKQSIQLLNEYRSSLISNVINGKVKV
jgi:putative type I restriction enzyme, DNA specificity subunit